MKAERRHALKENDLVKLVEGGPKIMQLPDLRRKFISRAAVVIAVICVIFLFVRMRITTAENALRSAQDHLSRASQHVTAMRTASPGGTTPLTDQFIEFMQKTAEQANAEIDRVGSETGNARLLAQAGVLRGDMNFIMASLPVLPVSTTSTSRPAIDREMHLSLAASAYQDVVDKYADQPINAISAHFGLAAIMENRGNFDDARKQYESILMNGEASPMFKRMAEGHIAQLPQLQLPVLLPKAETTALIATSQPAGRTAATTRSTTLPATRAALPATRPTTQAATTSSSKPAK
jgi:hypothetical protein